jgi:CRP-like cAMP-binding protein
LRWFGTLGAAGLALAFVANLFLLSSRVLNARIITVAEFLNTRLGRIEEIPLFADMSPFQAKLVVLSGHLAKAEPGTTIARKGESSSELYLLLDGKADVRNGVDGPIVGAMKRGDVVGEMGLVRGAPRSADVVASEPVEYLVLDGEFLQRLRRQYPRTAAALLFNLTRILSDRLDRATGRISALESSQ